MLKYLIKMGNGYFQTVLDLNNRYHKRMWKAEDWCFY